MKRYIGLLFAAIISTTAFPSSSQAGAWTQPFGGYYEKLAFNYYYADYTFDSSRNRIRTPNNGRFSDYNISNYFEVGVTDKATVINSVSYKWLDSADLNSHSWGRGMGDVDLGGRFKLFDGRSGIISTQFLVKVPGQYGKTEALPLGNGQYDLEVRLLYGRSFWPLIPGYGNIEAGYRWRAGAPSNEFRYLGEFGVDFTKTLYGRAKLDGTLSSNNGSKMGSGGNPTATNNYDLGKLDLAIGYKVKPSWGLEGAYVKELYGKNTSSGSTFTLAVYFKTP